MQLAISKIKYLFAIVALCSSYSAFGQQVSGNLKDEAGNMVNAHGEGVFYHNGTYYLFGEIKKGKTWLVPGQQWGDYRVPAGGVLCYSSSDLEHWKYMGV